MDLRHFNNAITLVGKTKFFFFFLHATSCNTRRHNKTVCHDVMSCNSIVLCFAAQATVFVWEICSWVAMLLIFTCYNKTIVFVVWPKLIPAIVRVRARALLVCVIPASWDVSIFRCHARGKMDSSFWSHYRCIIMIALQVYYISQYQGSCFVITYRTSFATIVIYSIVSTCSNKVHRWIILLRD